MAIPRQTLQNVPCEDATAGKLCSVFHQAKDRVFSLAADYRKAAQVDNQFAAIEVLGRVFPAGVKLIHPGGHKLSFHH